MNTSETRPRQLVIVSGKGGTGKTSLAASFAQLNQRAQVTTVIVDADVDASNLELLLEPYDNQTEPFHAGVKAYIDPLLCIECGRCEEACRFSAISSPDQAKPGRATIGGYFVNVLACEGCAACQVVCPVEAISMQTQQAGIWQRSNTRFGMLYHASLFPGQENSGKLVTLIKQQARLHAVEEGLKVILVDGPPGIGCPVISAFSGADLALIITEATLSGLSDLERILTTIRHFKLPAVLCINKSDLNPQGSQAIRKYAKKENLIVLGEIPYDPVFLEAVISGKPVTDTQSDTPAQQAIHAIWQKTLERLWETK